MSDSLGQKARLQPESARGPEGRLEAALWDMDGVIVDTADLHYLSWKEAFARRGLEYTMAEFMRHFGQRHDTIIQDALGADITPGEAATINDEKQTNFRRRLAGHIKAVGGSVELIKSLRARGIKQAVASSAPLENIDIILKGLDIGDCFQAIAFGTEVAESKPSPQLFLLAASKLGVKPADCVVFEDSIAGVAAARGAGMKCVALTTSHSAGKLRGADLIVAAPLELAPDDLAALFHPVRPKKK